MPDQNENSSSRPGIVIIAIVALLLVAGIAIWFTAKNNPLVQETKTSSTTVRDIETRENPPAPGSSNVGDNNSGTSASPNGMNPPDSTATTP